MVSWLNWVYSFAGSVRREWDEPPPNGPCCLSAILFFFFFSHSVPEISSGVSFTYKLVSTIHDTYLYKVVIFDPPHLLFLSVGCTLSNHHHLDYMFRVFGMQLRNQRLNPRS